MISSFLLGGGSKIEKILMMHIRKQIAKWGWKGGDKIAEKTDNVIYEWTVPCSFMSRKCNHILDINDTRAKSAKLRTYITHYSFLSGILLSKLFWPTVKAINPKYSKHWPYTVASTIDCGCHKMLNHGLNHGLYFSLFKLIPYPAPYIELYMC